MYPEAYARRRSAKINHGRACTFGLLDTVKLDESPLRDCHHGLRAIYEAKFAEDVLNVNLNSVFGDVQTRSVLR